MEFPPLPIGDKISDLVDFLLIHFQGFFDIIEVIVKFMGDGFEDALMIPPALVLIIAITALAFWRVNWMFGIFTALALYLIGCLQLWDQTISTLALVLTATCLSLAIGIPIGIAMAKSNIIELLCRPLLDLMQTMPAFVYLIPAAMFFGLGKVPGIIATVIFAMPPAVRLTNLGIRSVPKEMVEAGLAFGCTPRQLLFKVQIPNAMPSIMAGVNQNIMLALSMVVIASMIGAGGLGNEVLIGIQRMEIGDGFEGGLAVVIIAIILDRITQSFTQNNQV